MRPRVYKRPRNYNASRYHGCLIKGPSETPRTSHQYGTEGLKGDLNCRGIRAYTEKTMFPFPLKLNGLWSWCQFSFLFSELNGIQFCLKLKGKLWPRSYPIQCERKWEHSFLSVSDGQRKVFQSIGLVLNRGRGNPSCQHQQFPSKNETYEMLLIAILVN